MKAVDRFNCEKGTQFSTYAIWWIRQSILKSISDNRLIRLPLYLEDRLSKVRKTQGALVQDLQSDPNITQLAKHLDWNPDQVKRTLDIDQQSILSLECFFTNQDEEPQPAYEMIEDPQQKPLDGALVLESLQKKLAEILNVLSKQAQWILKLRYGLLDGKEYTLKQIGRLFNLSRERVRQIEKQSLESLKTLAESQDLKAYLSQNT